MYSIYKYIYPDGKTYISTSDDAPAGYIKKEELKDHLAQEEVDRLVPYYIILNNSRDHGYNTDFPHGKLVYVDRTLVPELGHYKTEQYIYYDARATLSPCGFDTFMFFMTLKPNTINGTPTSHTTPYEFFPVYAAKRIYSMPPRMIAGEAELMERGYLTKKYDNFYQFVDKIKHLPFY